MNNTSGLSFSLLEEISLPTIDLHGIHSITDAMYELERALARFSADGVSACRIVHGIGSGVLADHVRGALATSPLVFDSARTSDGGSTLARL